MKIPPQKLREIVFFILYTKFLGATVEEENVSLIMEQLKVSKTNFLKGLEKAKALLEKLPEIDLNIEKMTESYEIDRIQTVEKVILRIGIYELLFEKELPAKVSISE